MSLDEAIALLTNLLDGVGNELERASCEGDVDNADAHAMLCVILSSALSKLEEKKRLDCASRES